MENNRTMANPWIGLNSYTEGTPIYGRDEEIASLTSRIQYNLSTVVYGKSGIGKSSIINAGVFPRLREYGIVPVYIRLEHNEKPYIEQIVEGVYNCMSTAGAEKKVLVDRQLDKDGAPLFEESLWEYLHRVEYLDDQGNVVVPLIVIDQFEEIFTLERDKKKIKDFFVQLADLLNGTKPKELMEPVVEPTLKEDLTTTTAQNPPEKQGRISNLLKHKTQNLKRVNYLSEDNFHLVLIIREDYLSFLERNSTAIPSLKQNRYCLEPISEEQAAQIILQPRPGLVDIDTARLIIEKVTNEKDFEINGIPEIVVDSAVLSLYLSRLYDMIPDGEERILPSHIEKFGDNIIKDFYYDSIAQYPEPVIEFLEDNLINDGGYRENISVYNALQGCESLNDDMLNEMADKHKLLRKFSYNNSMRIEFVHDILCPVIMEHKAHRLEEHRIARIKQEEEEEHQRKIAEIEKKNKEEKERLQKAQKRIRARAVLMSSLLLATLAGIFIWYFLNRMEFTEEYATFTTKNGWPIGLGKKLSSKDKKSMPFHYQLVKYGYKNNNTRVNIKNAEGQYANNIKDEFFLVSFFDIEKDDEKAKEFAKLLYDTSYWVYTPDINGEILRKTAYSEYDEMLYSLVFYHSGKESGGDKNASKQLWATVVDKEGKPLRVRDNGADRVLITSNDNGFYSDLAFFNELGVPVSNSSGYFEYTSNIDEKGNRLSIIAQDEFGDSIEGSSTSYTNFDKFGRWKESSRGKAIYNKNLIVTNSAEWVDTIAFDKGELVSHSRLSGDLIYEFFHYDGNKTDNERKYEKTNNQWILSFEEEIKTKDNIVETITFFRDSINNPYRVVIEENKKNQAVVSYFGGMSKTDVKPIDFNDTQSELYYHKLTIDTVQEKQYKKVIMKYYDSNDELIVNQNYNTHVEYLDSNNDKVKEIMYNGNEIYTSCISEFDEKGRPVSQSVLGLDGSTPIRCKAWELNKLCYYKMKLVYDFSGTLISIKGVNEFGEVSLITKTIDTEVEYSISLMDSKLTKDEGDKMIHGKSIFQESFSPIKVENAVEYIHITDLNGSWHKAGILDGDLLISSTNNVIKVARPNVKANKYDIKSFKPHEGDLGAEHYPVYFNDKEMKRYNQSIKTIE